MAITNVGEVNGSSPSAGPYSISYPSTTVDDVVLVFFSTGGSSDITWSTGVDDFTEVYDVDLATDDPRIGCAYHVIDGAESATFTVTATSAPGAIWWAVALRGCDTTTPIDQTGATVSNAATGTTAITGVTTSSDGNWAIIYGASSEADGAPSASDNSFTELEDAALGAGGNGIAHHAAYKEITTAGAVGTTTITWGGVDLNIGKMVSVNIAGGGGGGTTIPIFSRYYRTMKR
jgi:hypothetical protein